MLGSTATCADRRHGAPARGLYAVQFHPEVVHTTRGREILSNFLFDICGCVRDWDPAGPRRRRSKRKSAQCAGDRNVFFFVSGGVDSTVAYTLCLRALGPERVHGVYVDTGLMREGETDSSQLFGHWAPGLSMSKPPSRSFWTRWTASAIRNRSATSSAKQFVRVQERILESRHLLDGHWILGQGTIYPDTIESGGTAKADRDQDASQPRGRAFRS